jgi:serine/threonine protein kinase
VAYELLSGSVLFKRDEPMAVLYAHLYAPPPRLTAVRPDLPGAVDEVLARALAKAPDDRYDSCGAFADALREALGVEPYDPGRPVGRPSVVAPGRPGHEHAGPVASTLPLAVPPDSSVTRLAAGAIPPIPTITSPPVPLVLPGPPPAATWTAVVTADRAYYNSVDAVNDQDAASISFPAYVPERRFPLSGSEVRIGRRSVSRGIEPEIDLTGPPTDTGVSRLHAKLVAGPDRSWSVVDLGSPNGIQVNGKDVPSGEAVSLRDGDRIHLGAWTMITIARGG